MRLAAGDPAAPSSSLAGVRRGLVLQLGGPEQSWIWYWTQSTTAEDYWSVVNHGGHSSLTTTAATTTATAH
ncbi:hypothetical protein [Synechococcus sp. SynAce01]|uniref:hypothetical protein n=1 Tax=Synechococcus sp. SynAce01 TaxID=1916956 RepID=UPI000AB1EA2B|nr:hypothetical protein [Synechococcus sp. SynAce01]